MDPPPSQENDAPPTVHYSQSRRGAEAKRARESPPSSGDFYHIAKDIQNRHKKPMGSETTEDRRFRAFFGCSAAVAVSVWGSLVQFDLLPHQGQIVHLLWALFFLKCYPTEAPACAATGGHNGSIDPKTLRKFIWPFIEAIANLEPFVVCGQNIIVYHILHFCLNCFRFYSTTGTRKINTTIACLVLMGQTFKSQSVAVNGIPSSSRNQALGMKLACRL